MRHEHTGTVLLDYCQLGTPHRKTTATLADNNCSVNSSVSRRCKQKWVDKRSIRSATGSYHTTLSGFVNDAESGDYKTKDACLYSIAICEDVAPLLVNHTPHTSSWATEYRHGASEYTTRAHT